MHNFLSVFACKASIIYTFLDTRVSRRHLSFRAVGNRAWVKQLGGTNGALIIPGYPIGLRVPSNLSVEPMEVGEEREVFDGEIFTFSSSFF